MIDQKTARYAKGFKFNFMFGVFVFFLYKQVLIGLLVRPQFGFITLIFKLSSSNQGFKIRKYHIYHTSCQMK